MSTDKMRNARSVLARIEAAGGKVERIHLSTDVEDSPALEDVPLRSTGRYDVLGRVARGGMGLVLVGRDIDLSRDVALKVLREKHTDNGDLVRRFVEEAQIGGQLQHPGVVPIYELGLLGDRRPYFAMKLVKGETLAARLGDRPETSADRRRFLGIFAQVCRAMEYAHSRGVIHRDLKPSNVMVGNFGEVMVVDWGFAKVLARGGVADERRARRSGLDITQIATLRTGSGGSDSIPGSIMGTPSYMPPEQALGRIDDLDERSDVFSLGGILLEILTGEPVYVGNPSETLVLAAGGKTEAALERLDAGAGDPAMVDLCRRCLSLLQRERPRNAGVLAEEVESHLAAADDRARKSRVAAAESRRTAARAEEKAAEQRAEAVKAAEQAEEQRARAEKARARAQAAREDAEHSRRSRKLTVLIGGAVALAVTVALGGWLLLSGRAREERHASRLHVREALGLAWQYQAEGRLDEAEAEGKRALRLSADGDPESGAAAQTILDSVKAERSRRHSDARLETRKRRLAEGLRRLRIGWGPGRHSLAMDAEAIRLLERNGLPVGSRTATEVGRQAAALGDLALDVANFLDELAWLRRQAGLDGWEVLSGAAAAIDADPERNSIRAALETLDADALRVLVRKVDPESADGRTLSFLGMALDCAGDTEGAVEFLHGAWLSRLTEIWVQLRLARSLERLSPPRLVRASPFYASAYAILRDGRLLADLDRTAEPVEQLTAYREAHGWRDSDLWFTVDIEPSVVTETRVRVYVEKDAVTRALLAWPNGVEHREFKEPPLKYPAGTLFVAESLADDGNCIGTRVLRLREGRDPEFLWFDAEGCLSRVMPAMGFDRQFSEFVTPNVPSSCEGCHVSRDQKNYFEPTVNFPDRNEFRNFEIPDEYRDLKIVNRFRESFHRSGGIFGPYGAIWLSKLKADAASGRLSEADKGAYSALRLTYPDLLKKDED